MPQDLRRMIEDFRRNEPDIPTRPEAIRRLLKQAVMARQGGGDLKRCIGGQIQLVGEVTE
jgi:hypothetical protein